jgi:hypothetical protein
MEDLKFKGRWELIINDTDQGTTNLDDFHLDGSRRAEIE